MGQSVFPAPSAASKTRYVETLTSGTSWTVPAGVTYVNATLVGAGGQGGSWGSAGFKGNPGHGGQIIHTTINTTPGASISYSIGAGGSGTFGHNAYGGTGGNTTFTGATTALGGYGGATQNYDYNGNKRAGILANNGGEGMPSNNGDNENTRGSVGGAGQIIIEYWK
jgi:hypothetical protein